MYTFSPLLFLSHSHTHTHTHTHTHRHKQQIIIQISQVSYLFLSRACWFSYQLLWGGLLHLFSDGGASFDGWAEGWLWLGNTVVERLGILEWCRAGELIWNACMCGCILVWGWLCPWEIPIKIKQRYIHHFSSNVHSLKLWTLIVQTPGPRIRKGCN